ncbi:recombinase family protein [Corallibacter sp.]|uniref:recombinase family protein n=1 Tax=Corallibacter sp. TaxID=2038084 RepID=UPI003AB6AFF9
MLAIYTRISKDRDNQISTEVQKEKGIELSNKLKIPYKLYEEAKGTSGGKSIEDRPKLNELVDDIYDDNITAVYFYNQDRSARDEVTWFTLANLLIEKKVNLYENGLLVDLNNEDTYMLSGFKAIMNASERRKTGKKIKDALFKKAKQGIATNPVLPYGYKKNKNKMVVVNDDEALIVKQIFEKALKGKGSSTIANELNEAGIKTRYALKAEGTITVKNKRSGRITTKNKADVKWQQNTVLQILKNTWYIGQRPYKGEIFEVPSLFSEDYFYKVNEIIKARKRNQVRTDNKFLLGHLIRCNCGRNMYGVVYEKKKENYYKCNSNRRKGHTCGSPSINRPYLENLIWNKFFKEQYLIDLVVKHFDNTDKKSKLKELKNNLNKLQLQLEQINEQKNNTITYGIKNIITQDELENQLKRIRKETNDINVKILNTKEQLKTYEDINKSQKDIINDLNKVKNKTSFNDKKQIIEEYINHIVINFERKHYIITIEFKEPIGDAFHFIVHKRWYYAVEHTTGDYQIINKFQKMKKGKPVDRTDMEFFKEHFDFETVQELRHKTLRNYYELP